MARQIIKLTEDEYELSKGVGHTKVVIYKDRGFDTSMVRFNIRQNDIFVEFGENDAFQLQGVKITFRARLVRERFLKVYIEDREEVLATMPMF